MIWHQEGQYLLPIEGSGIFLDHTPRYLFHSIPTELPVVLLAELLLLGCSLGILARRELLLIWQSAPRQQLHEQDSGGRDDVGRSIRGSSNKCNRLLQQLLLERLIVLDHLGARILYQI